MFKCTDSFTAYLASVCKRFKRPESHGQVVEDDGDALGCELREPRTQSRDAQPDQKARQNRAHSEDTPEPDELDAGRPPIPALERPDLVEVEANEPADGAADTVRDERRLRRFEVREPPEHQIVDQKVGRQAGEADQTVQEDVPKVGPDGRLPAGDSARIGESNVVQQGAF